MADPKFPRALERSSLPVVHFHFKQEYWLQEVCLVGRFFGVKALQQKGASTETFGVDRNDSPGVTIFQAVQNDSFTLAVHFPQ